jgi:hypothetical protein
MRVVMTPLEREEGRREACGLVGDCTVVRRGEERKQ